MGIIRENRRGRGRKGGAAIEIVMIVPLHIDWYDGVVIRSSYD